MQMIEETFQAVWQAIGGEALQSPLWLDNSLQNYDWGTTDVLPWLLGIDNPQQLPQAEVWVGAHPKSPSQVIFPDGNIPLDQLIHSQPHAILGARSIQRFGPKLPFLFKILSAKKALSIQVHPDLAQAKIGFEHENSIGIPLTAPERNYQDANHKPELLYALTPFVGLVGFKPIHDIVHLLTLLGEQQLLLWAKRLQLENEAALAPFYSWLLRLSHKEVSRLLSAISPSLQFHHEPAFAEIQRLVQEHASDSGILAPLVLNLVSLVPGDAIFIPARTPHAYLRGTGIEVMACSDNVLRAGLTKKHIAPDELLATVIFRSMTPDIMHQLSNKIEQRFPVSVDDFEFSILQLQSDQTFPIGFLPEVELLYCLKGNVTLMNAQGESWVLTPAMSALLPAASQSWQLKGQGKIARVHIGPSLMH
jgi:mannose-6-phosphate isomerase